jgi:chloride channel protein, CIC family
MSDTVDAPVVRWWQSPLRWLGARFAQREQQVLLILSIMTGALTGLAVVALLVLTERLGLRMYPVGSPVWRRIATPVIGSLSMGYVLFRYFPDARGSGVTQTKVALFVRDGVITLRTVFGKFFCTAVTLGSGIPLGPEGPSVHVGAGIASVLGRRLGLRTESVKSLVPVGAAAAIAAAFNTPLTAVVYALEEIVGDLNAPVLGSIVLASATAWMMLRIILGSNPLFKVPQYELVHSAEFAIYAVLGVAGGVLSAVFARVMIAARAGFRKLPDRTRWVQPVCGGLLVGLLGWWLPQVLGVGYSYVGDALNGRMALRIMGLLVLLKFASIITSYASGNAGGLFAPSLFLGAMLGGVIGSAAHYLWPSHTAEPGAYALVGMGALFAGIMRTPITSVLMIFETTRDYAVIVPLMIANLLSFLIASQLQPLSISQALAVQDGIHLPGPEIRRQFAKRIVAQVMRQPTDVLSAEMTVQEAAERTRTSAFHVWPVMNDGALAGIVGRSTLRQAMARGEGAKPLKELASASPFPHVHADHPLDLALERMGVAKVDLLPVVSRANVHVLLGTVALADILSSFGVSSSDARNPLGAEEENPSEQS